MKSIDERIRKSSSGFEKGSGEVRKRAASETEKQERQKPPPGIGGCDRKDRDLESRIEAEISEAEHARILRTLDAVAALSLETGPSVSNRDHDRYLYGGQ